MISSDLPSASRSFLMEKSLQLYKMNFADCGHTPNFAPGEMAEWSNAAVLKTVDCNRSGGSNPSLSAGSFHKAQNPC